MCCIIALALTFSDTKEFESLLYHYLNYVHSINNLNHAMQEYVLGMQQYGSLPYCVLPLNVLQYIAVLQYMIKFEKRTHHVFKT